MNKFNKGDIVIYCGNEDVYNYPFRSRQNWRKFKKGQRLVIASEIYPNIELYIYIVPVKLLHGRNEYFVCDDDLKLDIISTIKNIMKK